MCMSSGRQHNAENSIDLPAESIGYGILFCSLCVSQLKYINSWVVTQIKKSPEIANSTIPAGWSYLWSSTAPSSVSYYIFLSSVSSFSSFRSIARIYSPVFQFHIFNILALQIDAKQLLLILTIFWIPSKCALSSSISWGSIPTISFDCNFIVFSKNFRASKQNRKIKIIIKQTT